MKKHGRMTAGPFVVFMMNECEGHGMVKPSLKIHFLK